jgi:hypothetical protein
MFMTGRYDTIMTRHAVLYTCRQSRRRSHRLLRAFYWFKPARASVLGNTPFIWVTRFWLFKTRQKIITLLFFLYTIKILHCPSLIPWLQQNCRVQYFCCSKCGPSTSCLLPHSLVFHATTQSDAIK